VEVRVRSARLRPHLPSVETELPVCRCSGGEVMHAGAGWVGQFGFVLVRAKCRLDLSCVAEVSGGWIGHASLSVGSASAAVRTRDDFEEMPARVLPVHA